MTKHKALRTACIISFISSALVNNFAPLLFSMFRNTYGVTFEDISALIACNFITQVIVAMASPLIIKPIGNRIAMVYAHLAICIGLAGLAFFPDIIPGHFPGLLAAVVFYSAGSGLINIAINPVIDSFMPSSAGKARSLLYSAYCWGFVFIVMVSTLFFTFAGYGQWRALSYMWIAVPLTGAVLFAVTPINAKEPESRKETSAAFLMREKLFVIILLMMVCAGASEQAMSQWASMFAEVGLGVSKGAGDLAGPCLFALMMGFSRVLYPSLKNVKLTTFMAVSACLCCLSYILAAFSPINALAFAGCGLCGFAIGIFWPGTVSISVSRFPGAGAFMFAALALAGSVGSAAGPAIVGLGTGALGSFRPALFVITIFPAVMAICLFYMSSRKGFGL